MRNTENWFDEGNWLDQILPFPRPEYAKQTESLLTDLLWRSPGSSLAKPPDGAPLIEKLAGLKQESPQPHSPDPDRLVPKQRHGSSQKNLFETIPVAETTDVARLITHPADIPAPTAAVLHASLAPRARGDKSDACVPLHPDVVSLQTLHGLVNKQTPANLALAIETMGWLGGAPAPGQVAATYLEVVTSSPSSPQDGVTGLLEALFPAIAKHVWNSLPSRFHVNPSNGWPAWPEIRPVVPGNFRAAQLAAYKKTPFAWFWQKWRNLCNPINHERGWRELLPARRFADWALCLLRTGLAFAYLWEAEFFYRLHKCIVVHQAPGTGQRNVNAIRSLLTHGAVLACFEPPSIPASQKGIWPATAELLARGYEARRRFYEALGDDRSGPLGTDVADKLENWVNGLSSQQVSSLSRPLQTHPRTANNQKEFVRYLLLPRASDDDSVDQADFYYLARSNTRHLWFQPGPEWLVVVTSLLCEAPGGECTLGQLMDDLASLGVRVERSVLVNLLEKAGLSTDSPDADNALVIRAGF
jgi:hypothetical protein